MLTTCVRYSCKLCGLTKIPVDVPARGAENVRLWMAATVLVLADDHTRRSPDCHAGTLHDIMIPITGTDRVGGPVNN